MRFTSGKDNQKKRTAYSLLGMLVVFAVFAMSNSALAQRTTGTLRGQVLDPSGASIPGAQVTVTNNATGIAQTITSTSAGTYSVPSLLPGNYTVAVQAKGFQGYVNRGVAVLADQDNVADAKLQVGTASTTVEVTAGASPVQTTSSSLNNNFNANDVVNLPSAGGALNGSPLNLAILAPNVIAQPGGVTGIGGSVGGTRPRDNNFNVDGVDDNNLGVTGPNSTVIPDAVAEFALQTNQFSAEYGHSAGGQFNLVTKSGSNNWHGSAYEYLQNRNLNANDNLTKSAIASGTLSGQPPYDNNRFGGNLGGPIIKNKWFVFGNYEYTTLHGQGTATFLNAPTADGLATMRGMAADSAVSDVLANYPVAPAADPSLAITVNGATVPVGPLVIFSPVFQREHDAVVNSDFTTGHHQVAARFLFNQEQFILPVNSTQAEFNQLEPIRNRKIALTDTWTLNDHSVNDLRLQYSYYFLGLLNPCKVCPPDVTIGDLGATTVGPGDNQTQKQNSYQIKDNIALSRGKHMFKFGGEYSHFIYPQFFLPRSNGDYWYNSAEDLVNDLLASVPGRTLRNAGTGSFLGTQSLFGVFAQDDVKVTPRLTLNLGLRYEFWTNPVGVKTQALNSISNVPGVISFGVPRTDRNNVAPRVGFAWDPSGNGKTAIRGGAGISYDVKFQNFASITLPPQLQSEMNPDSACALSSPPSWCANANGAGFLATGGLPQVYIPPVNADEARSLTTSFIDDTVMPKIITWTLSVQQQLLPNSIFEVRYLGTRGLELPVQYRRNHISAFDAGIGSIPTFFRASDVPTTWNASTPTDTAFNDFETLTHGGNLYHQFGFNGNITADPPMGSSIYHALSGSFTQRLYHGVSINANYTWAHTIDNSTNEFFTSFLNPRRAQDTNRLNEDRSNSDLDVRQKFALAVSYDTPRLSTGNGFLNNLLGGYGLGIVYLAQTGQPVTLQSGFIADANGNGDTAGDRAVLNPFGTNPLRGSDIFPVCADPGGTVSVMSTTVGADGAACSGPTIGYLAQDPTAKYVAAGGDVRTTVGRNSFRSPGFGVMNASISKRIHFTESMSFQVRADFFNVLNHRNFTISNTNIFSTAGVTAATTNPGYVQVADPNFLDSQVFSGGNRQATLAVKLTF